VLWLVFQEKPDRADTGQVRDNPYNLAKGLIKDDSFIWLRKIKTINLLD
jgi:hypothetical protein